MENNKLPLAASLPPVMALAYLGDARHALYVREMLVRRGIVKPKELNRAALDYITAEAQARMYARIEDMLTDEERSTAHRAANSGHLNRPKHASPKEYMMATGFESVVGMLHYLGEERRLTEILDTAHSIDITAAGCAEGDRNDTEN